MLFEIKNRWSGAILFSLETTSMRLCVEAAIGAKANLSAANLSAANLSAANLSAANLSAADLSAADLSAANLSDADLSAADLSDASLSAANLSAANLSAANLSAANLSAANLSAADLSDANLRAADLRDANLRAANLRAADLRDANLRAANLSAANLSDANLRDANLSDANLRAIRDDFWAVLSSAPKEVDGLRLAIAEGRIDGSTYTGPCACLVGTIANVRGEDIEHLGILKPNSNRPIERFFLSINEGDTPETNQVSRLVLAWADEWIGNMRDAFGPKESCPAPSA